MRSTLAFAASAAVFTFTTAAFPATAQETSAYDARAAFAPFAPLIGNIWRGRGVGPDGASVEDVQRWDWAVGGHALRVSHAVNGGVYGGETLIAREGDAYVFHYFTTGGFHTTGTITPSAPGVFTIDETVHGASSVQRLRATGEIGADGVYRVRSSTQKDGAWVEVGGFDYRQDPTARVRLPVVGDTDQVEHGALRLSRMILATNGEPGDAAGYLRIANDGTEADQLIGASCDCAARIEIHRIREDRSGMDTVEALDAPAGGTLDIRPGSRLHLMLIGHDPRRTARLRLTFRDAGEVELPFKSTATSRASWDAFD